MRSKAVFQSIAVAALALFLTGEAAAQQVRIKDITNIQGMRDNQLTGLGLVTGLNGTGDGTEATKQAVVNMLRKLNINVSPGDVASANVALVLVTATLPPFIRTGNEIDVTVTSIGDANSLFGGTLVQTPLTAATGDVYAVAQGPLSIGGFGAKGAAASVQKNHTTVGTIPDGAIIEREVPMNIFDEKSKSIVLTLNNPDFATASRMAEAINMQFKDSAQARDMKAVEIKIPKGYSENDLVGFVARVHSLTVEPDTPSKVIISERTGTLVAGTSVKISTVAIAHSNLTIMIAETPEVSQPLPFSDGETTTVDRTEISVNEQPGNIVLLKGTASAGDLAQALNAIGATPRDLVVIFQLIKKAGALHADLELM